MYTRAYSHYHSRPVKPTPMELHNYAGCILALHCVFKDVSQQNQHTAPMAGINIHRADAAVRWIRLSALQSAHDHHYHLSISGISCIAGFLISEVGIGRMSRGEVVLPTNEKKIQSNIIFLCLKQVFNTFFSFAHSHIAVKENVTYIAAPPPPHSALKRCPEIMDGFQLALHQVHQAAVLYH